MTPRLAWSLGSLCLVLAAPALGFAQGAPERVWLAPSRCPAGVSRTALPAALRVELGARTVFEIGEEPSDRARRLFVDPASCAHPHTSQVITSFDPATGTMRGYRVDLHELPPAAQMRVLSIAVAEVLRNSAPEPSVAPPVPVTPSAPVPRVLASEHAHSTAATELAPLAIGPPTTQSIAPLSVEPPPAPPAVDAHFVVRGYFGQALLRHAYTPTATVLYGGDVGASFATRGPGVVRFRLSAIVLRNDPQTYYGRSPFGVAVASLSVGPQVGRGRFAFEPALRVEFGGGWTRDVFSPAFAPSPSTPEELRGSFVFGLAFTAAARVRLVSSLWLAFAGELGFTFAGFETCNYVVRPCMVSSPGDELPSPFGFNAAGRLGLGWNY